MPDYNTWGTRELIERIQTLESKVSCAIYELTELVDADLVMDETADEVQKLINILKK